jgi:hypothetical protein
MGAIVRGAADEETDAGWARSGGMSTGTDADADDDAALHREVPPHHGG